MVKEGLIALEDITFSLKNDQDQWCIFPAQWIRDGRLEAGVLLGLREEETLQLPLCIKVLNMSEDIGKA